MGGYCERTGQAFWSEPVNAMTNAAFLLAALLAVRDLRRAGIGHAGADLVWLAVVLAAIGIGSFLFHTLATGWAAVADSLPIALFVLGYVVVFAHRFAGLSWSRAWLAVPAFVALAALVDLGAWVLELPIPGLYLPALVVLAGLTGWLATRREPVLGAHWRTFAVVTALFAASLTLRQLDQPLCRYWPLGTHFGWHLCNATVLYLLLRAATRRAATQRAVPVGQIVVVHRGT